MDIEALGQEIKVELARIADESKKRVDKLEAETKRRTDEILTAMNRSRRGAAGTATTETKVETEADLAFKKYVRKGVEALEPMGARLRLVFGDRHLRPGGGHLDVIDGRAGALCHARDAGRLRHKAIGAGKAFNPAGQHAAALTTHGQNGQFDDAGAACGHGFGDGVHSATPRSKRRAARRLVR